MFLPCRNSHRPWCVQTFFQVLILAIFLLVCPPVPGRWQNPKFSTTNSTYHIWSPRSVFFDSTSAPVLVSTVISYLGIIFMMWSFRGSTQLKLGSGRSAHYPAFMSQFEQCAAVSVTVFPKWMGQTHVGMAHCFIWTTQKCSLIGNFTSEQKCILTMKLLWWH